MGPPERARTATRSALESADMTRPEYVRMGSDFERIARAFGLELEPAVCADVRLLAACIDCVDRAIDGIREGDERRGVAATIIEALRTGDGALIGDGELRAGVMALYGIIARRGITGEVVQLAEDALDNTEKARTCTSREEYVARTVREGRLTVSMALLVGGRIHDDSFRRFMLAVAEAANLVDKLVDARGDAARGEISLAPSIGLHARLAAEVLRRLPALVRLHPAPVSLLAWSARSAIGLVRLQRTSSGPTTGRATFDEASRPVPS